MRPLPLLIALAGLSSSCSQCAPAPLSCQLDDDCPAGAVCVTGSCIAFEGAGEGEGADGGEGGEGEGEGEGGEGEGAANVGEGEGEGGAGEGEGEGAEGEGAEGEGEGGEGEGEGAEGEGEGAGPQCGNQLVEGAEACDSVDGCETDCTASAGFACANNNTCWRTFPVSAPFPSHDDGFGRAFASPVNVDVACAAAVDTDSAALSVDVCGVLVPLHRIETNNVTVPGIVELVTRDLHVIVGGSLTFSGSRVPVIVALGDVTIDGVVGSVAGGDNGVYTACTNGRGSVGTGPELQGGGGGGSLFDGGSGGCSLCGGDVNRGLALGSQDLHTQPFVGGCNGGSGGGPDGGVGGAGGGAVQITAAGTLHMSATGHVQVGGRAGKGGNPSRNVNASAGGGGGGGGAVLLEGHIVARDPGSTINLNGGGGGAGSVKSEAASDGQSGDDGAAGGGGGGGAGDGGGGGGGGAGVDGSAGVDPNASGGGGGGGGRLDVQVF